MESCPKEPVEHSRQVLSHQVDSPVALVGYKVVLIDFKVTIQFLLVLSFQLSTTMRDICFIFKYCIHTIQSNFVFSFQLQKQGEK